MKHLFPLLSVIALLLTVGCPSVPAPVVTPSGQEPLGGALEHTPSGMRFPRTVGNFFRAETRQYDTDGLDMSVAYRCTAPVPIVVTVYVYPPSGLPSPATKDGFTREHFEKCKQEILQVSPAARLESESSVSASVGNVTYPGYRAQYSFSANFGGHEQPLESLLYVFCHVGGKWAVKYRISYPAKADAKPIIHRFLKEFTWTLRAAD